ncbi:MAG: hypothetical protein H6658_01965 [Ardenticatenaceae bacterium]|nr:hypothetical protein [Ardenticatenaceae bacterium]
MDPLEEIKKLKAAEQNQPALWPMALLGIAVLFIVSSLWGWLLMQDNIQPLPTPIVTSAWQATRPLLPTPTLAPTRPRATAAPTRAVKPANTATAAPSATATVAATYTPYPTHTAAPTYTPYPTPTDAPTATATATDTPTPLPTASPTPTTQPTGTATAAPIIIPAPETAVAGSSGGWQQFILDAGMILVLIMAALLLYVEATTIRYRVRSAATRPSPPTPASPTPPTKAAPPRELRRVQPSSASSRRVEPVELVELEPVQGVQPVQLPFSKDRPPTAAEKAFIRKRYAETGNLTAICFECYDSKGGKVWDWVKEAVEEQGGEETITRPKQVEAVPRRQIFINTAQGRRGLHS